MARNATGRWLFERTPCPAPHPEPCGYAADHVCVGGPAREPVCPDVEEQSAATLCRDNGCNALSLPSARFGSGTHRRGGPIQRRQVHLTGPNRGAVVPVSECPGFLLRQRLQLMVADPGSGRRVLRPGWVEVGSGILPPTRNRQRFRRGLGGWLDRIAVRAEWLAHWPKAQERDHRSNAAVSGFARQDHD